MNFASKIKAGLKDPKKGIQYLLLGDKNYNALHNLNTHSCFSIKNTNSPLESQMTQPTDVTTLPFSSNYFDLIVSDGIKIPKDGNYSPKVKVIEHFKEIKRVLASDGWLCVGVNNKYGLNIIREKIEYDTNDETFSDSFYGYNSIFNKLKFHVKPYWVLPSYRKPHYSGSIEDDISLRWFLNNFNKFLFNTKEFAIIRLFLKITNATISKFLFKLFCPYFLFYCCNEEVSKTLEDIIIEKTRYKNFIQYVRSRKIMYILLDKFGKPTKILSCRNAKYDLTEEIIPLKRISPKMKHVEEKIVIEDWLEGDRLDRLNSDDINLVMKWLIDFQNNTASELFSSQDIDGEISGLKNALNNIEEMSDLPYQRWLDDYKDHICRITLKKTAVHGDLQPRNIFLNHHNSSVDVIDWELFVEKGNPLIDFMWFMTSIMNWSANNVDEFHSNIKGVGKAVPAIKTIKETMNKHFQADLNFIILLRFIILRWIVIKSTEGMTPLYLTYIEFLKILSDKNER